MRKICLLCVALVLCCVVAAAEKTVSVKSPDGQVKVNVTLSDRIYYDVESHGEMLLQKSTLGLELGNAFLGQKPALRSTKAESVNETVTPVFPLKCKTVENRYNQLTLTMKGGYAVQWRVYDDGVAYRILTTLRDSVEILSEDATLRLPQECKLVLQQARSFKTSCEEPYSIVVSSEWQRSDKMSELPVVICTPKQKILFSEFSLFSYPGMFLCGNGDNTLCAVHPRQPLAFGDDGDRSVKFLHEAHYIARTAGTREYPWRYMFITQDDRQLACSHAHAAGTEVRNRRCQLDTARKDHLGVVERQYSLWRGRKLRERAESRNVQIFCRLRSKARTGVHPYGRGLGAFYARPVHAES